MKAAPVLLPPVIGLGIVVALALNQSAPMATILRTVCMAICAAPGLIYRVEA